MWKNVAGWTELTVLTPVLSEKRRKRREHRVPTLRTQDRGADGDRSQGKLKKTWRENSLINFIHRSCNIKITRRLLAEITKVMLQRRSVVKCSLSSSAHQQQPCVMSTPVVGTEILTFLNTVNMITQYNFKKIHYGVWTILLVCVQT